MSAPGPHNSMFDTSHVRVGADLGGMLAVIGSLIVLLLGIPPLKWVLAAALMCGGVSAFALSAWHRYRPGPRRPPNSLA